MLKDINYSKIKQNAYAIDEFGTVYSKYCGNRAMKTSIDKDGYLTITLKNDRNTYSHFGIHRLLLIAFRPVENMENLQVNHIDGNKLNNSLDNLEWCSCEENLRHARNTGLNKIFGQSGAKHITHRISEEEAKLILQLHEQGKSNSEILKIVSNATKNIIAQIVNGRTWKYLSAECSTTIPEGSTSQALGDGKG